MYELNNSIREVLSEFFSNNLTIHSEHKEKFEEIIMKLDNIEFNSGLKSWKYVLKQNPRINAFAQSQKLYWLNLFKTIKPPLGDEFYETVLP